MMTVKLNGTDILQQMFQISSLQGITFQYIKVLKNFKDYILVNEYNIVLKLAKVFLIRSVGFKEVSYTCIKSIKIKRCIKRFGNIIFINCINEVLSSK